MDVVVCPPYVSLGEAVQLLGITEIAVAAQNVVHYQVTQPGRTRRSAPRRVAIVSATYIAGRRSISLVLGKPTAGKPLTLTVTGLVGEDGQHVSTFQTRLD